MPIHSHHERPESHGHHLLSLGVGKDFLELGLSQFFYWISRNLITLSLPYYLYVTLGWSLWQIALFFAWWSGFFVLAMPLISSLLRRYSLSVLLIGFPLGQIGLLLGFSFFLSTDFWSSLLLLSLPFAWRAVGVSVGNVAYDVTIAEHLKSKSSGRTLAGFQIMIILSSLLAPLLGAVVTAWFGFSATLYLGVGASVLSAICVWYLPRHHKRLKYSSAEFLHDVFHKTPSAIIRSEWGISFFDAVLFLIWPLFLILVLQDIISMGLLVGISSMLSMLISWKIGKKLDTKKSKKDSSKVLQHGVWRSCVMNFLRALWLEPIVIALIDSSDRVNMQGVLVAYNRYLYHWLQHGHTVERAQIRRFLNESYYFITYCLAAGLFWIWPGEVLWLFILFFFLSAFSMLGVQQVTRLSSAKTRS